MIDRGLKQIVVAKATPVLDGPLPVSTSLVECGPCHTRRPRARVHVHVHVRLSPLPAHGDRIGAAAHALDSAASNALLAHATDWKDDEPAVCARERTSGKMERGETSRV
ncbi:hypothetical protein ACS0PU_004868 [Formica fusca]